MTGSFQMNRPALLIVLALAAGLAGGFASQVFLSPAPDAGAGTSGLSPAPTGSAANAVDADRVETLELELASLQTVVSTLERQLQERRSIGPAGSSPEGAGYAGLAPAPGIPGDEDLTTDNLLDYRIEAVIDQREQAEEDARDERRAEERVRRMDRQMERLTAELGLDEYQAIEMRKALTMSDEKRSEFFTNMRESGAWDREAMREGMSEIREYTNEVLSSVLTSDQLSTYQTMEQDSFRGFGGGGPGGGGSRGGGGGGGRGGGGGGREEF